jgi:hypothetical protein
VDTVNKDDEDFRGTLVALARNKRLSGVDVEAITAEAEVFFNLAEAQAALEQLTDDNYLSSMLNAENPTGYGIYRDATSLVGALLADLASFATNEIRMRKLHTFVMGIYPGAILRERQDMKARFEVSSENVSIAQIFASIEENKVSLYLSDYGVSQTSLEQVFNMHAAEAEKLKEGRMDG